MACFWGDTVGNKILEFSCKVLPCSQIVLFSFSSRLAGMPAQDLPESLRVELQPNSGHPGEYLLHCAFGVQSFSVTNRKDRARRM
jgi:hypothetical protein